MDPTELVGEAATLDSWFFAGWRFLLSKGYRHEARTRLRSLGWLRAALAVCYATLILAAEIVLILQLISMIWD